MKRVALFILLVSALVYHGAVESAHAQDPPSAASEAWPALEEALQTASRTQRPVLVYVHAPWCAPCLRLERDVFPHLDAELGSLVKAAVDLSNRPEPGFGEPTLEWVRRFGLDVPPSFALLQPDGEFVAAMTGFRTAPELRLFLSLAEDYPRK